MCEFCTKHGEGKKWYLNVKNYSQDLLSDIKRHRFTKEALYWIDDVYNIKLKIVKLSPLKVPIIGSIFRGIFKNMVINQHWGQVVPIEDVKNILNFTNSITRVPCVCRKITTGKENRVCFLISVNPATTGVADIIDQSFFGGPDVAKFEKAQNKWTLDFMKENETRGMFHTIWTFMTPFIGALCNCDISTGCIAMKLFKEAMPVVFRAEYVAMVDENKCVGCQECIKLCQFGAIELDKKTKKIKIGTKKCYGCGICRSVCKKNAITLHDRKLIPEAANLW
jgi:Pyruvate/2-oxoacid:ferredoxin oxidoreductase delta subunit